MIRRALLATAALTLRRRARRRPRTSRSARRSPRPGDPVLFQVIVPNEKDAHTVEVTLQIPKDVLPFSFEEPAGWTRDEQGGRRRQPRDGHVEGRAGRGRLRALLVPGVARRSRRATSSGRRSRPTTTAPSSRWIGAPDSDNPAAVTKISEDGAAPERGRRGRGRRGRAAPAAPPPRRRRRRRAAASPLRPRRTRDSPLPLILSVVAARARRRGPRPATAPLTMIRRAALLALLALLLRGAGRPRPRGQPELPLRRASRSRRPPKGVNVEILNFDDRVLLHNTSEQDVEIFDYENEALRADARPTAPSWSTRTRRPTTSTRTARASPRCRRTCRPSRQWKELSKSGRFEWHDHRMHWMGEGDPPNLTDKSVETKIDDWEIPIAVGGQKGQIAGTLTWVPLDERRPAARRDLRVRGADHRALRSPSSSCAAAAASRPTRSTKETVEAW